MTELKINEEGKTVEEEWQINTYRSMTLLQFQPMDISKTFFHHIHWQPSSHLK